MANSTAIVAVPAAAESTGRGREHPRNQKKDRVDCLPRDGRIGHRAAGYALEREQRGVRQSGDICEERAPVEKPRIRVLQDGEREIDDDLFVGPGERMRQAELQAPQSQRRAGDHHEDETSRRARHRLPFSAALSIARISRRASLSSTP
jgi:hypothetical protein